MIHYHSLDILIRQHLHFHSSTALVYRQQQQQQQQNVIPLVNEQQQHDEDIIIHATIHTIRKCILNGHLDKALDCCNQLTTCYSNDNNNNNNITIEEPKIQLQIKIHKLIELLHSDEQNHYSNALLYSQQLAHFSLNAFPEAYVIFTKSIMLFIASSDYLSSNHFIMKKRKKLFASILSVLRLALGSRLSNFEFMLRYLILIYISHASLFENQNNDVNSDDDDLNKTGILHDMLLNLLNFGNDNSNDDNDNDNEKDNIEKESETENQQNQPQQQIEKQQKTHKKTIKKRKRQNQFNWSFDTPLFHPVSIDQQIPKEKDVQILPERLGITRQEAVNSLKLNNGNVQKTLKNELSRMILSPEPIHNLIINYCIARGLLIYNIIQESSIENPASSSSSSSSSATTTTITTKSDKVEELRTSPVDNMIIDNENQVDDINEKHKIDFNFMNNNQINNNECDYFRLYHQENNSISIDICKADVSNKCFQIGDIMKDVRNAIHLQDEHETYNHLNKIVDRLVEMHEQEDENEGDNGDKMQDIVIEETKLKKQKLDGDDEENEENAHVINNKDTDKQSKDKILREVKFRLSQREVLFAFNQGDISKALKIVINDLAPKACEDDQLQSQLRLTLTMLACSTDGIKKSNIKEMEIEKNSENDKHFDNTVVQAESEVNKFCSSCEIADGIYDILILTYGQPELVAVLTSLLDGYEKWLNKSSMKDEFSNIFSIDFLRSSTVADNDSNDNPYLSSSSFSTLSTNATNISSKIDLRNRSETDNTSKNNDSNSNNQGSEREQGTDSRTEETILTLMEFLAMSRAEALAVVRNHPRASNAEAILDSLLGTS